MITIEPISGGAFKVHVIGKLHENDFKTLEEKIDPIIKTHQALKLMIDATQFDGWANMDTASRHFSFVREHQKRIERIALVAGHEWQHWIAGIASVFVHPEIKVFDKGESAIAQSWLTMRQAA